VTNYHAQNLYYKYGFASAGIRPKYYQDNQEDALIMTLGNLLSEPFRKRYKPLQQTLKDRFDGFPIGMGVS